MITLTTTRKEAALLVNRLLLRDIPFTVAHAPLCDPQFQFSDSAWFVIHKDRVLLGLSFQVRFPDPVALP